MKEGDARGCTQMGPCGSPVVRHAPDHQARLAEIKSRTNLRTGRFEVIDALYLPRVVQRASTDHSACFYLRVLRVSPSFICGKTLPLRCFQRTVTDVLASLRCVGCVKRSQPWNQAWIDRSKPL